MATSLDLAEADKPNHVQFNSLLPMIKNGKPGGLKSVYGTYVNFQRMVVSGNHKLLLFPKVKKALLFNLKNDPEEMKDISKQPGSQKKMKSLFNELIKLQKDSGDTLELGPIYPELAGN